MKISMLVRKSSLVLLLFSATPLGFGCSGISTRPDGSPGPQLCPAGALETMQRLGIDVADSAFITIDPNREKELPFTIYEGPIESVLTENLGPLPAGTRILGRVWTGGLDVVIRYHEAHLPRGTIIPFCGVARDAYGGMKKQPASLPGLGIIPDGRAAVWVVDTFR
jgi:hypothetical protein